MKKLLFILLFPLFCNGQSLPLQTGNFLIQQKANGYVMRGIDIVNINRYVLSNNFNVICYGNPCSNLSANMTNSYPMEGTSLLSQIMNLVTPASDAITWNGSPTANDGSVTFNGTTMSGTVTATGSSLPTGSVAISMNIFFKFSSNPASCCIAGIGRNTSTADRLTFFYQANQLTAEAHGQGATINWTWDNLWHMFTITKPANGKPTDIIMYLDGSLASIASTSGTTTISIPTNSELSLARLPTSQSLFFPGTLKYYTIWSRVLTAGEVLQLWNTLKFSVGL